MPIATTEVYAEMLDRAKAGAFAYPAINVTSSQTLNAALAGFAEAGSDGIVQVSTGGAEYLSGPTIKDMVLCAEAGAMLLPAMPAFYQKPKTLEHLADFMTGKILGALGFKHELYPSWKG